VTVDLAPIPPRLYRIGRAPDPLAFPPAGSRGIGRFTDPEGRKATLLAAVERRAAFLEALQVFRPDLAAIAERDAHLGSVTLEADVPAVPAIPDRFMQRLLVAFTVAEDQAWLDARQPDTLAALHTELEPQLAQIGIDNTIDLAAVLPNVARVSRLVAGWAIDNAFDGIAYRSGTNLSLTCWAIFEGARIEPLGEPMPINPDDPDLHAVAKLWNLRLPARPRR
jgi:hypothetical protein